MSPNEPPDRVVGLRYEPGEGLPAIILKGSGPLAQALLAERRAQGMPVVKDEALAQALYQLPLDCAIGPALYEAVAVLLSHVFAVDGKLQGERQ